MPDRDSRTPNRRPQGDRPQASGKPPAVNFVYTDYDSRTEKLSSAVLVTRGDKPAVSERVSFLVDDEQIDLVLTDGTGKARVHTKHAYAPGTHKVSVQVANLGLSVNETFTVSSQASAALDRPVLVITSTYVHREEAFHVVLAVKVSQRGGVLPQCEVHMQAVGLDVQEFTNEAGEAQKLILVPHPTSRDRLFYEVRVSLPDYGVYENVILDLQRPSVKSPTQLTVMRPVEVVPGSGTYTMRVLAEHEEGLAQGVTVSVAGGTAIVDGVTDRRGIVDLTLQCAPGETFTVFQVDVAGIDDTHELTLLGKSLPKAARWKRYIGIGLIALSGASVLNLLGVLMHAVLYLITMAKLMFRAQDVPDYSGGTYAFWSVGLAILFVVGTIIALAILFGPSVKAAWDRARWRYHFARSGTVLQRDEPTMWGVVKERLRNSRPQQAEATVVAPAEGVPVPVVQPVAVQAAPAASHVTDHFSMTNLAQWGSIIALAINELLLEERRK